MTWFSQNLCNGVDCMSLPLFFKQIHSQTIGFVEWHGSSYVLLFLLTAWKYGLVVCNLLLDCELRTPSIKLPSLHRKGIKGNALFRNFTVSFFLLRRYQHLLSEQQNPFPILHWQQIRHLLFHLIFCKATIQLPWVSFLLLLIRLVPAPFTGQWPFQRLDAWAVCSKHSNLPKRKRGNGCIATRVW